MISQKLQFFPTRFLEIDRSIYQLSQSFIKSLFIFFYQLSIKFNIQFSKIRNNYKYPIYPSLLQSSSFLSSL